MNVNSQHIRISPGIQIRHALALYIKHSVAWTGFRRFYPIFQRKQTNILRLNDVTFAHHQTFKYLFSEKKSFRKFKKSCSQIALAKSEINIANLLPGISFWNNATTEDTPFCLQELLPISMRWSFLFQVPIFFSPQDSRVTHWSCTYKQNN